MCDIAKMPTEVKYADSLGKTLGSGKLVYLATSFMATSSFSRTWVPTLKTVPQLLAYL